MPWPQIMTGHPRGRRVGWRRDSGRHVSDPRALPMPGHQPALSDQLLVSFHDCAAGDAKIAGKRTAGGQAVTRAHPTVADRLPHGILNGGTPSPPLGIQGNDEVQARTGPGILCGTGPAHRTMLRLSVRRMTTPSGLPENPSSRSAETGRVVAAAIAAACPSACSLLAEPSGRPNVAAKPLLVVASAGKPSHSRSLAEPASHGFGISSGPLPWCSSRKRFTLSRWLVMASIYGSRTGRPARALALARGRSPPGMTSPSAGVTTSGRRPPVRA